MKQTSTKLLTAVLLLLLIAGQRAQAQKATASATQTLLISVPAMISVSFDKGSAAALIPAGDAQFSQTTLASGSFTVKSSTNYKLMTHSTTGDLFGTSNTNNSITGTYVFFGVYSTDKLNGQSYPIASMVGPSNNALINPLTAGPNGFIPTNGTTFRYEWQFKNSNRPTSIFPAPDTYTATIIVEVEQI